MMKRSWFYQNGLFYTLLALVLLLHMILLAIRFHRSLEISWTPPEEKQIKVRLIEDWIKTKKQIVQSEDPSTTERPDDTAYLSDKDRKFDRESVAKKIDSFKKAAKGEPGKVFRKDLNLSDLGAFSPDHDPLKAAAKEYSQKKTGLQNGDENSRSVSSTNDFVEEVPLGDLTYLNTVEYKYYGFYHRIRQKLEQFWGRSIQEKAETLLKNGRSIASDENLITSLEVTLNELGEIVAIAIKGTSGVRELDDAAVKSFNEAGPFPNPPKGLVVNGRVRIEWGFVVKT